LTLALIRRRDGPDDQALRIVRDAIMTLADGTAETVMAPTEAVHPVGKAKSKAKSRERTGAAPKKSDDDRTRAAGSASL
jgi:hypothetical protein